MGDLKTWVSDKLMSLLGYSQPTLVQYVISLSKKAKSPADVYNHLKDMGVSSSNDTQPFAEEIFRKVERKATGTNLYKQQEQEAAMLARKQKSYKLLEADDDEENDGSGSVATQSKKTDNRVKRFRKKSENQEDEDDDEGVGHLRQEKRSKHKPSRDETDDSELIPLLIDGLTILSEDVQNRDIVYNLLLVLSGILTDKNGQEAIVENLKMRTSSSGALTSLFSTST